MHRDLVEKWHEFGRHRTARLTRENHLIARQNGRFKRRMNSEHACPVAPKLVAQDVTAEGPDTKWEADISCIWTSEGWLNLTFFKTSKSELIRPVARQSRQQAENAVARYINGFYNPVRRHSSFDFQSPIAFERKARAVSQMVCTKGGQVHCAGGQRTIGWAAAPDRPSSRLGPRTCPGVVTA
ncbi:IS3 family transposase [Roseicyclus mahoneyensis]|jgi:transposase InsO family protein|uniref:IS3 family transposase n=1 Tax=Roseicyclus mahoneyensis TaxID=164332 RepID=UPI000D6D96B7|nr:IS3 family transposase [Roseicyclus mahoneyensis]